MSCPLVFCCCTPSSNSNSTWGANAACAKAREVWLARVMCCMSRSSSTALFARNGHITLYDVSTGTWVNFVNPWWIICSRVYIISSLGGGPNFSEGVHILQENKLNSGGSLFIQKLVPGGTNLGGSIFTMTCTWPTPLTIVSRFSLSQQWQKWTWLAQVCVEQYRRGSRSGKPGCPDQIHLTTILSCGTMGQSPPTLATVRTTNATMHREAGARRC